MWVSETFLFLKIKIYFDRIFLEACEGDIQFNDTT